MRHELEAVRAEADPTVGRDSGPLGRRSASLLKNAPNADMPDDHDDARTRRGHEDEVDELRPRCRAALRSTFIASFESEANRTPSSRWRPRGAPPSEIEPDRRQWRGDLLDRPLDAPCPDVETGRISITLVDDLLAKLVVPETRPNADTSAIVSGKREKSTR